MLPEIEYEDFMQLIHDSKSAIICGNGFSINFDNGYCMSNLGKTLFSAHRHIVSFYTYDVVTNENNTLILTENFKAAKQLIFRIQDYNSFLSFFNSAVDFAKSITTSAKVTDWLISEGYNSLIKFGSSPLDIIASIILQATERDTLQVNYEYWSILILFVLILEKVPPEIYSLDKTNAFVRISLAGSKNRILPNEASKFSPLAECISNGLYIYFRLLFSANILLEGHSVNVARLEKWESMNLDRINSFFTNFQAIGTTNYDHIIEQITDRHIYHLHGIYSKEKKRISSVSLGVAYNSIRYDLSTITIGDYFTSKSFFHVSGFSNNSQSQNTDFDLYSTSIRKIVYDNRIQVLVIFGLNLDNDYHILRSIQLEFESADVEEPIIIYCYYSDNDRSSFESIYYSCVNYNNTTSKYVLEKIKVRVFSSKELIARIF